MTKLEKMVMNQLTVNTFDFSNLTKEQLEALFTNFVSASIVLTDCQGNNVSLQVTEILNHQSTLCDEFGVEIEELTV